MVYVLSISFFMSKNYVCGVKRKLFESSFQKEKNQRIWSSMEKVMIKLVSKGHICQEYVNQRFQVLLWQFGYGFCTSLSS